MKFLFDLFPVLLFFGAYQLYGIYVATGVAIAASISQVGYLKLRRRPVETMHWLTLGLIVVFGGLTIALHDRAFIMWKPSVINWLFAAAFLASRFVGDRPLVERLMGHAIAVPAAIWRRLNDLWTGFFVMLGAANLYVAQGYFRVERELLSLTGGDNIDLDHCAELYQGAALNLCLEAQSLEAGWVNFKLFGMMGLTLAFVIAMAFYLGRHIEESSETTENR